MKTGKEWWNQAGLRYLSFSTLGLVCSSTSLKCLRTSMSLKSLMTPRPLQQNLHCPFVAPSTYLNRWPVISATTISYNWGDFDVICKGFACFFCEISPQKQPGTPGTTCSTGDDSSEKMLKFWDPPVWKKTHESLSLTVRLSTAYL